jgi:uncharacterized damage-inducible protein DinB
MNADYAKFLADYYAQLMESEFAATCKVLAAVPDDQHAYKPDEKSRTAWELATHVALSDLWFFDCIVRGSFAFDPKVEAEQATGFKTIAEVVAHYRREFPLRIERLRNLTPEERTRAVDFFGLFQKPAVEHLGMHGNHTIHHRGQLASYLRAMGSKVPAIYGGSADEPFQS